MTTETMMPERVQLRRVKGWKMPPNTVNVARPTRWGNPFRVGVYSDSQKECVDTFRWCTSEFPVPKHKRDLWKREGGSASTLMAIAGGMGPAWSDLWGKNLACWCKPGQPCHADVLLELANQQPQEKP